MRIAIIGAGISGSLTARLLASEHEVTLFEGKRYAGGHANTVDIDAFNRRFSVDTGFMVFNRRTYPNFCRMLEMLQVESQTSDMSFSVRCSMTGIEYNGNSLDGIFAQRRNCLRPSFLRMLGDIIRFNRKGMAAAASGELKDGRTVGEFLEQCRVGKGFVRQYLAPMAAAIWSSNPRKILDFPAEFMIGFFANHGLMQLRDRPIWRTIVGGSRNYVEALLEPIRDRLQLGRSIRSVARTDREVIVNPVDGPAKRFDEVVFATHANQTLKMLSDATRSERQVLSAFPYQPNQAVLHTDQTLLPQQQRAWASWNYHLPQSDQVVPSVTYDLNRLQNLNSPKPILLTLNETRSIDPHKVLRTFEYHHPAFSLESIAAQQCFKQISGIRRTHYCGAYWGYGFHEDGVNSALAVTRHFGIGLNACTAASMKAPSRIAVASP